MGKIPLVVFIILTASCQSRPPSLAEHVFHGLPYLGAEPLREDFAKEDVFDRPEPPANPGPVPSAYQKGMQYRFLCPLDCPVDDFTIRILPQRLAEMGATNTKHPNSPSQLLYPFVGGPLFEITFDWNHEIYRIRNTPNHVFIMQVPILPVGPTMNSAEHPLNE
jgi:hypothetical protein